MDFYTKRAGSLITFEERVLVNFNDPLGLSRCLGRRTGNRVNCEVILNYVNAAIV